LEELQLEPDVSFLDPEAEPVKVVDIIFFFLSPNVIYS